MDKTESAYCRLCAQLKPYDKLTDLQTEEKSCEEIVNKLTRLNCQLDFNENILPTTVCLPCINSLARAFAFVISIDQAQTVLKEEIISKSIKKEVDSSDEENFIYEPPEIKYEEDIDLKVEPEKEETSIKPALIRNNKKSTENQTNKDFPDLDSLPISQLKLTWNDYSWKCVYCETQFPNIDELRHHAIKYHKSCSAYRCTDCGLRKLRLDTFVIHVRKHRKYLKMSCYKCFKVFPSVKETNKHKTVHITTDFKCQGCNTNFSSLDELNKHTNIYYQNVRSRNVPVQSQNDSLTCLVCKKKYKNKTSLNTHLLIHTDRKRDHICEVCGKSFLHKQNLAGHLMLHNDKRPFHCEICKSSFRTKSQLRKHVAVHDGEKPFSCEQCGRRFRLQKQLKSHSIIHTDSLPYVCSYCNKGFRFKTILNQHIRQHTGVKPYSCDICQRDFTNWPNYNKHMKCRHSMDMAKKKHTPEGLYPLDPKTGQVIFPKMEKMLEWKNKILEHRKRGRPMKSKNKNGVPEHNEKNNTKKTCD